MEFTSLLVPDATDLMIKLFGLKNQFLKLRLFCYSVYMVAMQNVFCAFIKIIF